MSNSAESVWRRYAGPKREDRDGRHRGCAKAQRVVAHRVALDAFAVLNALHALDGAFDQPLDQRRRRFVRPFGRLHRAQDRGVERGLVLFQVQRHLFVGDLAGERTRKEPRRRADQRHAGDDAEPEDGRGGELEGLERVGNRQDGGEPGKEESDSAAQRQLEAPPPANLPNHVEQLRAGIAPAHAVRYHRRLLFSSYQRSAIQQFAIRYSV